MTQKKSIFGRTTKGKNYRVKDQNSYSYEQFAYINKYEFVYFILFSCQKKKTNTFTNVKE